MKISITKRGRRNELRCIRSDGSVELAELGPKLPHHDLAHFVVERQWRLGAQSLQAEILTRALQALSAGACAPEQFAELVNTELEHWHAPRIDAASTMVQSAAAQFRELTQQFERLGDGESLQLTF